MSVFNHTKNVRKIIVQILPFIILCSGNTHFVFAEFPVDTSYTVFQTYQKLKKNYPDIKIVYPSENKNIMSTENIVYKTIDTNRALQLDIYQPKKAGKYPALIMIHGGGWRSGNKNMQQAMAQAIAAEGFVTIAVEYRLSLEAKYPAAVHDIKTAIRFVKDNAEKFSIDTTKIAIEGESAGGQLALLVAMTNGILRFDGDNCGTKSTSTVHAVIDVDGIVSFLMPGSLNIERKPDSPDAFWLGGTFADKPMIWKEASPLFYVAKNSVPTLFICSSVPRFHAGRDEMIDMLSQNGIYSESHTLPDSPHSFWLFEPWFESTKEYIVRFLRNIFSF